MRKLTRSLTLAVGLLSATALPAAAEVKAIASIKPIHSLVASVMQGVGEPDLIIEGAGSPHTYSLRPSMARKIAAADLVFWVDPNLETFLTTPLANLADNATIVQLSKTPGLIELAFREGGDFEAHEDEHGQDGDHAGETAEEHAAHADEEVQHDHAGHAEEEHHDDHAGEEDHHDHAGEEEHDDHADENASDDGHNHDHGAINMHIWLDPDNAILMTSQIEQALSKADPDNKDTYARNAENTINAIQQLTGKLTTELKPLGGQRFIVFHDAYEYFENRFGLTAAGSVTVSPEVLPGARRVSEVREKIKDLNITCVFSEPQFNPKIVNVVTESTSAKTGQLDPLGATLQPGPQLYGELLQTMATSFKSCLK